MCNLKSNQNHFQTGVVIVNIIPGSIADKDKRLQVFDQILDINALKMTPELSSELVQRAVKQVQSKVSESFWIFDAKSDVCNCWIYCRRKWQFSEPTLSRQTQLKLSCRRKRARILALDFSQRILAEYLLRIS